MGIEPEGNPLSSAGCWQVSHVTLIFYICTSVQRLIHVCPWCWWRVPSKIRIYPNVWQKHDKISQTNTPPLPQIGSCIIYKNYLGQHLTNGAHAPNCFSKPCDFSIQRKTSYNWHPAKVHISGERKSYVCKQLEMSSACSICKSVYIYTFR